MDYKKLQNGSDIRGVAMEGVPGQTVNLTGEAARRIGAAFVVWLLSVTGKQHITVSIGRDSRLTGEALTDEIVRGVTGQGADIVDFGLASTPSMFMSTVMDGYEFDGAMMLTASHLPFNRNGVKFFTPRGGLEKADITEILRLAESGAFSSAVQGRVTKQDFLSVYAAHLVDTVRRQVCAADYNHPLAGFHIVVDAGNGAGGFYVDRVLAPLGADTAGSQYLEPDGRFPNHAPNPEDPAAMDAIAGCVLKNKADFGIIFDTDVDRAGAVLPDGKELNRNRLIALISAVVLEEHPGTTIVTDSITSTGLAAFIAEKGGVHRRFKRGYRNVINESIRLNELGQDSQLAIETSGHGALKENYFLDDGAYLITKLLIRMARCRAEGCAIGELIASLAEPAESVEVRMAIRSDDPLTYGGRILSELSEYAEAAGWTTAKENFEGVRIEFPPHEGNGWFLLRMSLHDPLMPLNIESDEPGGVPIIAGKLRAFLSRYPLLDTEKLDQLQ